MYAIYQKYAKIMLNSSYRIVRHTADAEDITQEAFLDAFRSLKTYSGTHSFEGWLKRIVINKSISFLRRKKAAWIDIEKVPAEDKSDYDKVDEEHFIRDVQRIKDAVAKLPQQQQLIFTLYAIDDLPHQEIGDMLNLSPGNVRIIYHRAKNKIIELIKSDEICRNA